MKNIFIRKIFLKIFSKNYFQIKISLLVLFLPPIIYKTFQNFYNANTIDERAFYPTYKDTKKAKKLFKEQGSNITTNYRSFIGWRRNPVKKELVNINKEYSNRASFNQSIYNSTWFFGGSTIWGTGASDMSTIPSFFAKNASENVFNFGETGWTSRQSLNELLNIVGKGIIPKRIIFYDGVNEVLVGCIKELKNIPTHNYENYIDSKMKSKEHLSLIKKLSKFLLNPYLDLVRFKNRNKSIKSDFYDCDINKKKAEEIASNLINNWYTAYLIAKANNFEFYAILQPYLRTSSTIEAYIKTRNFSNWDPQFNTIYKLIETKMSESCYFDQEFCSLIIDGTKWIKVSKPIFIDYFHLNEEGNEIISKEIIREVNSKSKL